MSVREQVIDLKERVSQSIIGQEHVVEHLLLTLLCNGNLLLEGLPGLAKTRAVKSLAKNLESEFNRVQFTPDLLPSDITGSDMYFSDDGQGQFKFQPGPLFGNLILADEINRAPAKVQAALLEAMEERQITVAGTTHKLPDLFMVMATQNPIEQEGTYPLPEAQMDRFLMHIMVTYTDEASEVDVIHLVRGEHNHSAAAKEEDSEIPQSVIFEARSEIAAVEVADAIDKYIVAFITATREAGRYDKKLAPWIQVGASPRGGIALDQASRAHAWLHGQDFVSPDDVRAVIPDCLRHRIKLSYEAHAEGVSADDVLSELLSKVAIV